MGFFSKPDQPAASFNAPLTRDRVEAFLKSKDWHYFIDSDGDLGGNWDGKPFYFFLMGKEKEILQVRGRWHRTLPANAESQVCLIANEFNRDKIWPKVYTRVEGENLAVYTEVSTDLEFGVADDQLGQLVECGIYTGLQFFDFLTEKFPDFAADVLAADASPTDIPTGYSVADDTVITTGDVTGRIDSALGREDSPSEGDAQDSGTGEPDQR